MVFGALAFGFLLFAGYATRDALNSRPRADAIVVLTGGEHRIIEAARLLADGKGRRLLISGVNRRNGKDDMRRITGLDASLFDCCVDLGYLAQDTMGNADEARQWAEAWRFNSLIVVTASYHMPRSIAVIGSAMPSVDLIAHPVLPRGFRSDPWWLNPATVRTLLGEYVKLVPAAAMYATSWLLHLGDSSIAAAARPLRPSTG